MEKHFLTYAPIRHRGHPHRAKLAAHEHDRIVRAARPIPRVGVAINLRVGLPRVATAQIVDALQPKFLHLRDLLSRDDQCVLEAGNRESDIHRRRHRGFPNHVALGVATEQRERGVGGFYLRKNDAVLALIKLKQRSGDLPLKLFRMHDVELRRRAIREALEAQEHDFFRQALGHEPVTVEIHDPRRARRRLNRSGVSPSPSGPQAGRGKHDANQSNDEAMHGLFLPDNFGETIHERLTPRAVELDEQ